MLLRNASFVCMGLIEHWLPMQKVQGMLGSARSGPWHPRAALVVRQSAAQSCSLSGLCLCQWLMGLFPAAASPSQLDI